MISTSANAKQLRRSILLLCALLLPLPACSHSEVPEDKPAKDWRKDYQGTDDVPAKRHLNHPHAKKSQH